LWIWGGGFKNIVTVQPLPEAFFFLFYAFFTEFRIFNCLYLDHARKHGHSGSVHHATGYSMDSALDQRKPLLASQTTLDRNLPTLELAGRQWSTQGYGLP
jgi:hypothetical protein